MGEEERFLTGASLLNKPMFEIIEQNKRRSVLLIVLMGILLIVLGYAIGATVGYESQFHLKNFKTIARTSIQSIDNLDQTIQSDTASKPPTEWSKILQSTWRPGPIGVAIAVLIWLIMTLVALYSGDHILLRSIHAMEIGKEHAPQLWNVVEEMCIASGLSDMPRVFIIHNESPNAFAVGRKPEVAAVAVTSGLLKRLNRDELQGVIGHEIAHVQNLDIRFMTLAGVMLASVAMISDLFFRSMRYSTPRRTRSSKGGGATAIVFLFAIVLAILAPICSQALYFACSRRREYLADASAALYTRYPEGLAGALEKIAVASLPLRQVNRALMPMLIVNPMQTMSASSIFSTHPPTDARIAILRSMGGGAGYREYETAYQKILQTKRRCIDSKTLNDARPLSVRGPTVEKETQQQAIHRAKDVAATLDHLTQYLPILCSCGLAIKLPPTFSSPWLRCPRCGTEHSVPVAATSNQAAPRQESPSILTYRRRQQDGWETFKCECGHPVQLSPSFSARHVSCRNCSRHIEVLT